jgi:hypothetical protein
MLANVVARTSSKLPTVPEILPVIVEFQPTEIPLPTLKAFLVAIPPITNNAAAVFPSMSKALFTTTVVLLTSKTDEVPSVPNLRALPFEVLFMNISFTAVLVNPAPGLDERPKDPKEPTDANGKKLMLDIDTTSDVIRGSLAVPVALSNVKSVDALKDPVPEPSNTALLVNEVAPVPP